MTTISPTPDAPSCYALQEEAANRVKVALAYSIAAVCFGIGFWMWKR